MNGEFYKNFKKKFLFEQLKGKRFLDQNFSNYFQTGSTFILYNFYSIKPQLRNWILNENNIG